jgi:hypothetical protein
MHTDRERGEGEEGVLKCLQTSSGTVQKGGPQTRQTRSQFVLFLGKTRSAVWMARVNEEATTNYPHDRVRWCARLSEGLQCGRGLGDGRVPGKAGRYHARGSKV